MATFDYLRRTGETVEQAMNRLCETYYNFKSVEIYSKYVELCNEQYDLFYAAVNTNPLEPRVEDQKTARELAIEAFNKHVRTHGNLMDWLRNNKHGVGKNWIDAKQNPNCLLSNDEIEASKQRMIRSN